MPPAALLQRSHAARLRWFTGRYRQDRRTAAEPRLGSSSRSPASTRFRSTGPDDWASVARRFQRTVDFLRESCNHAFLHSGWGMVTETVTNSFLQRLIGAAALDVAIYEEVEADPSAMGQAFTIVVLSSLAAGFGASGWNGASIANIGFISIVALIAW